MAFSATTEKAIFEAARQLLAAPTLDPAKQKAWEQSLVNYYGYDDGSEAYKGKLTPFVSQLLKLKQSERVNYLINGILSEAILSQQQLAWYLETESRRALKSIAESYVDSKARVEIASMSEDSPWYQYLIEEPELNGSDKLEDIIIFLVSGEKKYLDVKNFDADKLYQQFWQLSSEEQIQFIQTLFDTEEYDNALDINIDNFRILRMQSITQTLLESFLPAPDQSLKQENDPHYIGAAIAEAAIQIMPTSIQARAIVGMMRAQRDVVIKKIPNNFGYKLFTFLEAFPGLGNKIAQLAHGMPNLIPEWSEGLSQSKSKPGVPTRAEQFRWMKEAMKDVFDQVEHFGAFTGPGSFRVTMEVKLKEAYLQASPEGREFLANNWPTIISVLRPGMHEDTEKYADVFINVVNGIIEGKIFKIKTQSDLATQSARPILGMLRQTKRRIGPETDLRETQKQEKIARHHTNGLSIKVGDYTFKFHTAKTLIADRDYAICRKIEGRAFNDLADELKISIDQKGVDAVGKDILSLKASAAAMIAFTLLTATRGQSFDCDMHGHNIHIGANESSQPTRDIYLFDFGAICPEDPNKEQRQKIIEVIIDAAKNFFENSWQPETGQYKFSFGSSLKHTIGKTNEQAEHNGDVLTTAYLNAIEQTIAATGDYGKWVKSADILNALEALIATGEIHGDIMGRVVSAAPSLAPSLKDFFVKRRKSSKTDVKNGNGNGNAKKQKSHDELSQFLHDRPLPIHIESGRESNFLTRMAAGAVAGTIAKLRHK